MYYRKLGQKDDPEMALRRLTLCIGRMSYADMLDFLYPCFKTQKALKIWVDEQLQAGVIGHQRKYESTRGDLEYFLSARSRLEIMSGLSRREDALKMLDAIPDTPAYERYKSWKWTMGDRDYYYRDDRKKWVREVMTSLVKDTVPDMTLENSYDPLLCSLTIEMLLSDEFRNRFGKTLSVTPGRTLMDVGIDLTITMLSSPGMCNPDDVVAFVKSKPLLPRDAVNLFEEYMMVHTHFLKGDMVGMYDILKNRVPLSMFGEFMMGVCCYFGGEYRQSAAHFAAGIKLKPSDKKWIGEPILDVIYVSALLMDDSAKSVRKIAGIMEKDVYNVGRLIPVMLLIRAVKGENIEKRAKEFRNMMNTFQYESLDLLVSSAVLIHLGELAPDDPLMAKVTAERSRYPQFALFHDDKFLPPYQKPQKWESAINSLMNKLGYSDRTEKAVSQPESRVAYLLYDNKSVQPILQKTKDGIIWSRGRNIAMATFKSGIPEMTEQDMAVASKMKVYKGWYGALSYELGGEAVIALLAGSQSVFCGDNPDVRIDIVKEEPYIVISKTDSGFRVESNINPNDISGKLNIRRENVSLYKVFDVTTRQKEIITSLCGMTFPSESETQMKNLTSFLAKDIQVHSDIVQDSGRLEEVEADSRITAVLQPRDGGLVVDLYSKPFTDVSPYITPAKGNVSVMSKKNDIPVRTVRNLKTEKANLDSILAAFGDIFPEDVLSDSTTFVCEDVVESLSVLDALNGLKEVTRIEWPEGCKFKIAGSADVKDFNISVSSKTSWFEVEGDVRVSEDRILKLTQVLEMFRRRKGRFIEIGDGEYLAMTEKLRRQIELLDSYTSSDKGKLKMAKVAAAALSGIEKAGVEVKKDAALKKLIKKVKASEKEDFAVPDGLSADLREYQTEGFRWMCRLAAWGAGACLADDMGLGKTVQTLAVLLRRAQEGPALIVAPASVMPNWQRESERFSPSLKFTVFNTLSDEERKDIVGSVSAGDVILTTYGVLASETESLKSVSWNTVVLDEAHVIKNKETKQSSACMELSADFRVILTGTPLQNNLGELWNLFQFINPGILGTYNHFKEHFLIPIQEHQDRDVQKQLKRLVQPFILRRTKADVLDELPEKTEQILNVELSENEMALYESVRREAELELSLHQSSLVKTISDILKLRQIVCSPALVGAEIAGESSKIKELMRLVPDLISGQHRALVFSQFTSFLALVRKALDDEGIQYMYLDGSTPVGERQNIVRKFQKGDYPLFLISLKAGGLGLNLTAADYIIHLDPWWNPAVEDQASDRAYRIGQTKPVTVYKLIAKNTIEEKIVALHKTKKSLADSLLEGSDVSARLSREELLELLGGSIG